MAVDPSTLQSLAQNRLSGQLSISTPTSPSAPPAPYQPYQPSTNRPALADPEAPLQARQQQLNTQMSNPSQDPRYRAFEDTVTQQGAAAKEQAQEHLRGAADPLAVQRQLQQYDFNTQAQLANRAADLFSQANAEQGNLATQTSGLRQTQANQAQQNDQFQTGLGVQSGQFGATLANNQNQFQATQAQQAGQFGQSLAQNQGQFDTTAGQGQQRINNQVDQFGRSLSETQRQFDIQPNSTGQKIAGSVLGGIASAGIAAPVGQALGGFVNNLFGNSQNGETTVSPQSFGGSSGGTPVGNQDPWYAAAAAASPAPTQAPASGSSYQLPNVTVPTSLSDSGSSFDLFDPGSWFDDIGSWF